MFALPPKADMCGATRDVRYGPIADIVAERAQSNCLLCANSRLVNEAPSRKSVVQEAVSKISVQILGDANEVHD
jgi:hypothetical protein